MTIDPDQSEYPSAPGRPGLPHRLYKFRAVTPATLEFVSRIFTHDELYFPSAAQLNDPWESRPRITISGDWWTAIGSDGVMREVPPELVSRNPPPVSDRPPPSRGHEIDAESLAYIRSQVGQPYNAGTLFRDHPRFRLCSFAATERQLLLWSHYADAHRGLCVGFSTAVGAFSSALGIRYQSEYPVLPAITDRFTYREAERAALLHKSNDWRYENEYRLITGEHGGEPTFLDHRNVYRFPAEAVVSVVLGCEMPEATKTVVRGWLSERAQAVDLFQARIDDHRYELVFDRIA